MTEKTKHTQEPDQTTDTHASTPETVKTDSLPSDTASNAKPEKTNTNKTDKASTVKKANRSDSKKANTTNKKTSSVKWLIAFSLLFSMTAVALSGWLYYQSLQNTLSEDIERLSSQQNRLSNALSASTLSQSQLQQLASQVSILNNSKQSQDAIIATAQTNQAAQLASFDAKLNRLDNTTKEDWKLAEAEYLIRLANQRLLLESDTAGALTLLSSADDILNELKDPITFATRKALAKDMQALDATSDFDLEGAYLTLNALYDRVTELPQREPSQAWQAGNNATDNATHSDTDETQSTLDSLWSGLRSLVVISYDSKPIKALLPPAEYQELITGLQLQIDIAQVSLIKREKVIYQHALSRVENAIAEHFDTQSNSVIAFTQTLSNMQQINPAPELPQPRDSLLAITSLMKSWNKREQSEASAETTGDEQ